jgi:glycosyltransferase involved in cell wall biosynthesis
MAKAEVLFVHNNFPGQFGFIASALKQRGMRCAAIGSETSRSDVIPVRTWKLARGTGKDIFPLAIRAEADLLRGRAAAEVAVGLRDQGFNPQLIIGHPGWGETTLLSEVFPNARQILHGEYWYNAEGGDVGFDKEFGELDQEGRFRIAAKNACMALAYVQADRIVSPTAWQASQFPPTLRDCITVIHEGVDTAAIKPRPNAKISFASGTVLDRSTPMITFINRNLEPLRGFHVFMRALPELLQEVPEAHVVIIGHTEGTGYGGEVPGGGTWRSKMLKELEGRLDMSRMHFAGRVPHNIMLDVLSISAAHVYFTYPFVLSWSLLEAMASECLILGSDTPPVREVVQDGVNGRLIDFFDVKGLSRAMIEACQRPADFQDLRRNARKTVVEGYDQKTRCRPAWLKVVDEVLALGTK